MDRFTRVNNRLAWRKGEISSRKRSKLQEALRRKVGRGVAATLDTGLNTEGGGAKGGSRFGNRGGPSQARTDFAEAATRALKAKFLARPRTENRPKSVFARVGVRSGPRAESEGKWGTFLPFQEGKAAAFWRVKKAAFDLTEKRADPPSNGLETEGRAVQGRNVNMHRPEARCPLSWGVKREDHRPGR